MEMKWPRDVTVRFGTCLPLNDLWRDWSTAPKITHTHTTHLVERWADARYWWWPEMGGCLSRPIGFKTLHGHLCSGVLHIERIMHFGIDNSNGFTGGYGSQQHKIKCIWTLNESFLRLPFFLFLLHKSGNQRNWYFSCRILNYIDLFN